MVEASPPPLPLFLELTFEGNRGRRYLINRSFFSENTSGGLTLRGPQLLLCCAKVRGGTERARAGGSQTNHFKLG